MANAAKAKGSNWERQVCDFLQEQFDEATSDLFAERIPAGATLDRGDIFVPGWTIECKAQNVLSLGVWMAETLAEQVNRNTPYHLLSVKRRGYGGVADAFALMSMEQAARLMIETNS